MAATGFMREVEVRISEGHNAAAVDLFPVRHAINGWIDDVRLYDRELSNSEVRSIYESAVGSIQLRSVENRSPEQSGVLDRADLLTRDETITVLQSKLREMRNDVLVDLWKDRRRWFTNERGHEFVVVPSSFAKSGDESLDYDFAIGIHPVTAQQYENLGVKTDIDWETVESRQSPADRVSWFRAAEYCNELSKLEGIPENQWCFAKNEDGEYDWGMTLKPNFQQLRGYRLPTRDERIYAGRCHAKTRYFFGEPGDLADEYAWYASNSLGIARDVCHFPPNGFGIFDLHGNVWEHPLVPSGLGTDGVVSANCTLKLRSGAVNSGVSVITLTSYTSPCKPSYVSHNYGFRLAKSLPSEDSENETND